MPKIILTKGLPGSGKSSWAKEYVSKHGKCIRVNKDDFRGMFTMNKRDEDLIMQAERGVALLALTKGFSVVVDDTNLHPKHETYFRKLADDHRWDFEVKSFLDVTLDQCIKADLKREKSVGEKVIRDMYNQFVRPDHWKAINNVGPKAIVCDLDGTLAIKWEGRGFYDATGCDKDTVNQTVNRILDTYSKDGYSIIFVSGREQKYVEETVEFLYKAGWRSNYNLFMRETGDTRQDGIVKKEIAARELSNKYQVEFVLDDRTRVVDAWRDIGYTCFQVNDGNF